MAVLSNCTCGCEPICEPGSIGSRNWNVCCFNCGARSATFSNRTEAVTSWNQIITDNQKVIERPAVTGFIDQAIQHIRVRPSAN